MWYIENRLITVHEIYWTNRQVKGADGLCIQGGVKMSFTEVIVGILSTLWALAPFALALCLGVGLFMLLVSTLELLHRYLKQQIK